jgi:hypothetical protein
MAAGSRPVRIARRAVPAPSDPSTAPGADPSPRRSPSAEGADPLPPHGNRAGLRRARRLLLLYLVGLLLGYAVVTIAVASSPYAGVRTDLWLYVFLSVLAAASAIGGYLLTVGRAPWAVYVVGSDLVVRERFGRVRRFPIDPSLQVRYTQSSGPSFLSPEPTDTVRIRAKRGPVREYVVEKGRFDELPELAEVLLVR